MSKPALPAETVAKWQRVVDLAACIVEVPSSLVMRTEAPDHRVLVSSASEGNPYRVGLSFRLNSSLYCYAVLRDRGELVVRDAAADPVWCDNQDLEHGMTFYIGYPLAWPDGEIFGTICVLDRRDNTKAMLLRQLLVEFARLIESDLALLCEMAERRRLESELEAHLAELEQRVEERTRALEEANTALRVLLSQVEASRHESEERILRQLKGLVAPHVAKLRVSAQVGPQARASLELIDANLKTITTALASRMAAAFERLTPTEAEIAQMVMTGRTTKEIAKALSRETSTVDFHRNNIRRKLGVGDRGLNLRSYLLSLH